MKGTKEVEVAMRDLLRTVNVVLWLHFCHDLSRNVHGWMDGGKMRCVSCLRLLLQATWLSDRRRLQTWTCRLQHFICIISSAYPTNSRQLLTACLHFSLSASGLWHVASREGMHAGHGGPAKPSFSSNSRQLLMHRREKETDRLEPNKQQARKTPRTEPRYPYKRDLIVNDVT